MLLDLSIRIFFLWAQRKEAKTPPDKRASPHLASFLYYSLNTLLIIAVFRWLIVAFLAFSTTKWAVFPIPAFLQLPNSSSISTTNLFGMYRQADALVDIILRAGVDPITASFIMIGLLAFFLFLNYATFNLNDRQLLAIFTELGSLHQEVQVEGREAFGRINWKELIKHPAAFLRSKGGYLVCLFTGKQCVIRRQRRERSSKCFFPYLRVRNHSRMALWTYFHEVLLIGDYLIITCK